jgi:hypothetical protein
MKNGLLKFEGRTRFGAWCHVHGPARCTTTTTTTTDLFGNERIVEGKFTPEWVNRQGGNLTRNPSRLSVANVQFRGSLSYLTPDPSPPCGEGAGGEAGREIAMG